MGELREFSYNKGVVISGIVGRILQILQGRLTRRLKHRRNKLEIIAIVNEMRKKLRSHLYFMSS